MKKIFVYTLLSFAFALVIWFSMKQTLLSSYKIMGALICDTIQYDFQIGSYTEGLRRSSQLFNDQKIDLFVQVGEKIVTPEVSQMGYFFDCEIKGRSDLTVKVVFPSVFVFSWNNYFDLLVLFFIVIGFIILVEKIVYIGSKRFFLKLDEQIQAKVLNQSNEETEPSVLSNKYYDKLLTWFSNEAKSLDRIKDYVNNLQQKINDYQKKQAQIREQIIRTQVTRKLVHDIRSPISLLKVLKDLPQPWDEKTNKLFRECLNRIFNLSQETLVKTKRPFDNQLIKPTDGAKISNQTIEHLLEVDVLFVVKNLIDHFKILIANSERRINFKLKASSDLSFIALGNQSDYQRVFSILIQNAIEAIKEEGSILIQFEKTSDHLVITIKDTGEGMPSEIIEKLGKEEISYGKSDGNGIGVLSVYETISGFGGNVHIESILSKGTSIVLTLLHPPINNDD